MISLVAFRTRCRAAFIVVICASFGTSCAKSSTHSIANDAGEDARGDVAVDARLDVNIGEACDYADDFAALAIETPDGWLRYDGTTVGAAQHTASICSDLESEPEGSDVSLAYTPTHDGMLEAVVAGDDNRLRPTLYVRTRCDDSSTERGCTGAPLPSSLHLFVRVVRGERIYIMVSAGTTTFDGAFQLDVRVTPTS